MLPRDRPVADLSADPTPLRYRVQRRPRRQAADPLPVFPGVQPYAISPQVPRITEATLLGLGERSRRLGGVRHVVLTALDQATAAVSPTLYRAHRRSLHDGARAGSRILNLGIKSLQTYRLRASQGISGRVRPSLPYSEDDAFVSQRLLMNHRVSRRSCQRSCQKATPGPRSGLRRTRSTMSRNLAGAGRINPGGPSPV